MIAKQLKALEVSVSESPLQLATFRSKIPQSEEELVQIETRSLFRTPIPCKDKD